ncbi:type II toxin-antitoxin system PemK/MazF family toxin [Tsukamurella sp. 1534]|uniref:type II toxin-antitoxin system PemK/MazF family toxin n=1 Tax=Tsukamurella sp. 1534 TaxID=1151061 RepID=UPI0002FBB0B5|nr:type II toxin-antitoxin system PemK/MazF family toxin [Tsukamurella sp. 1534]
MANDFTRFAAVAAKLAREHGPRIAAQVVNSPPVRAGREAITQAVTQTVKEAMGLEAPAEPKEFTPGRPVTRTSTPSELMARAIAYAPQLDGRADPGEVVWTWVEFEETTGPNAGQGKDRPVLVVGRSGGSLLGLMLSSQDRHRDDAGWVAIGAGTWDAERRPSWVRLDRVLDVPEDGIRREGAVLSRERFELVAERLRADYGWS